MVAKRSKKKQKRRIEAKSSTQQKAPQGKTLRGFFEP